MTPDSGLPPLFGAPWERGSSPRGRTRARDADIEELYAKAQIDIRAARLKVESTAVFLRKHLPAGEQRVVDEIGFAKAANAVFGLEQELGELAEANK